METLIFYDKVEVINYLYSLENITKNTFEWYAKNYFDRWTRTRKTYGPIRDWGST